jgi:Sec-independent protein translocase protein TatA
VGFGSEIIFVLALGLVLLGPKRLHTLLGQVARAKAELENATRGLKSQLAAELDAEESKANHSPEPERPCKLEPIGDRLQHII